MGWPIQDVGNGGGKKDDAEAARPNYRTGCEQRSQRRAELRYGTCLSVVGNVEVFASTEPKMLEDRRLVRSGAKCLPTGKYDHGNRQDPEA